jgi:hypothetical protein
LDGSAITASEIDATVSRLMHAAKVTAPNKTKRGTRRGGCPFETN